MTFTAADHCTEREVGSSWEDCTFAAMLETLRLALPNGRSIPATITEVNRFRAATGLPDAHKGVNLEFTIPAAKRLYGLTDNAYVLTKDWYVLASLLEDPNVVAAVTGLMGAFPSTVERWDVYVGPHCVAKHGLRVLCDPLAPHGTYKGEEVNLSGWRTFFTGLAGSQAFVMRIPGGSGMPINTSGYGTTSKKVAVVKAVVPILDESGTTIGTTKIGARLVAIGIQSGKIACLFSSGTPWPDHVARPTVLFVAASAVTLEDAPIATSDVPPDATSVNPHTFTFTVDNATKYSETF
jgi:hypothetical protein